MANTMGPFLSKLNHPLLVPKVQPVNNSGKCQSSHLAQFLKETNQLHGLN